MATVRISELFNGFYPIAREAQVAEEHLSAISTYLLEQGAAEIEPHHFRVPSPCGMVFASEIERRWPDIKFVQVRVNWSEMMET